MEPFTPLDVAIYAQLSRNTYVPPGLAVECVVDKVLRKTTNDQIKTELQNIGAWLHQGLSCCSKPGPINKELFQIPFKVVEGVWEPREWQWYNRLFNENMVPSRSLWTCCMPSHNLQNAKELFYVFAEMLRQKFGNDANLMCILDDCLKRVEKDV